MQVPQQQTWQDKAATKVAKTRAKIPEKWILQESDLEDAKEQRKLSGPFIERFLDDREVAVIRNDTVPLLAKIKSGEYTALQVTLAFCKTAAIALQINNCLHEIIFDQAIQRANELDAYYKEHKTTVGPLHGIPVSLKDQFYVKGVDTTMGYIGWIDTFEGDTDPNKVHKVESQTVTDLLSLGAVIYCKTSLPQTLLLGETVNNLIGRTLNPVNQLLSCGGSSGGEGALNALRGSSLGIGTDIGGSVRIPAAFCGIYSVKPTHNRFSYRDVANTNPGQNTYASSVGFLSSSSDALELIMSSLLSTQPWLRDPEVVSIPWRPDIVNSTLNRATSDGASNENTPLKLGIYWTDGVVSPQPPIARGLKILVETLKNAGHKIVDWNPPSQNTAKRVHLAFLKADGAHDIHKQLNLSGEPLVPELLKSLQLREPMNLLKYQDLTLEGRDYCAAYSDYWNTTANDDDGQIVDAVIMPVAPHAAVIPGKYYHTAYTEAINLMDYSAAVIPVTHASKDLDPFDRSYEPLNDIDRKNWEAYDPEVYDGAPVGVQIVARKFEEEKVWAIGNIVSRALKAADIS